MIKERKPLGLFEVEEILETVKETDKTKEIKSYLKKFSNVDAKKSKKLKEELTGLGIVKLKEADIIKIIDIMPENAVELNKIVVDTSLDADETNKLLETIKKNK